MRISALEGKHLAVWGFGREGRAAWSALRRRFPSQVLTVLCAEAERAEIAALQDPRLTVDCDPGAEALADFDYVIKSPGISPYSPLAQQALARGALFLSGTSLWFAEQLPGLKLCVTGTKGKSTTSALIAHLLRSHGLRVGLAGNIGLPLLELLDPPQAPEVWVIELSSYQAAQAVTPDVALLLNLFPEHLDWHGSEARYVADKLALVERCAPHKVVLNARDPRLQAIGRGREGVSWFDHPTCWHLRDEWVFRGDQPIMSGATLALPGQHNRLNLCAALAAIEALGLDPLALTEHVASFRPLPHRLQLVGSRDGVDHIDDSISTTPHASLAALACFRHRRVALLVGGYDRGVDWQAFASAIAEQPPSAIIAVGQNGQRIFQLLQQTALRRPCELLCADDLAQAVDLAQRAVAGDGVVLLSPGAPSFGMFRDYADRGRAFARYCGFDSAGNDHIDGLGIA